LNGFQRLICSSLLVELRRSDSHLFCKLRYLGLNIWIQTSSLYLSILQVAVPFLGAYTTRARVHADMCTCLQESCYRFLVLTRLVHVCMLRCARAYKNLPRVCTNIILNITRMYASLANNMDICMYYIYIYIYIYIHTYIHSLFVSMCMCVYLERIDHMQITRHIYIYICIYIHTYIYVYMITRHVLAYIRTHVHMYVHTYMNTYE
jgi:hypothetical protein